MKTKKIKTIAKEIVIMGGFLFTIILVFNACKKDNTQPAQTIVYVPVPTTTTVAPTPTVASTPTNINIPTTSSWKTYTGISTTVSNGWKYVDFILNQGLTLGKITFYGDRDELPQNKDYDICASFGSVINPLSNFQLNNYNTINTSMYGVPYNFNLLMNQITTIRVSCPPDCRWDSLVVVTK